jgi:hypothetical protein
MDFVVFISGAAGEGHSGTGLSSHQKKPTG